MNNDIKSFHQQQAQQYKDYIKKSELGTKPYHDASQSTLMDAYVIDDDKIDRSLEQHSRPHQVNQGT